jgi:hypothetical protein
MAIAAVILAGIAAPAAAGPNAPGTGADSSSGVAEFLRDQRGSGVFRTTYFRSSKRLDDDTDFLGATVQIKALPRLAEGLDGKVEARITNSAIGEGGKTRSRLLEGYVTARFEKADLRIGKQIVAWGRADGINPTDNLTPRDFTVMLPFEDDQRFGTPAAKLDAYLSPEHTLTVFATPFFEPSRIPLPTEGVTFVEKQPARTLSNTEIGLKLNKAGEGFDWSVSYFRGFSLLPGMRLVGGTPAGPIQELHYDRITVLGADFARNYGRFGFRGEVAYVDTPDDAGTDSGTKNPHLHWVAGLDRTFLDNLNVNVQFFQRRVRRHQSAEAVADPVERGVAIQNAVLAGQRDRVSSGISLRVSNKWFNDSLEAEIFAVVNLTRNDRFVRPLLTYAFTDHWKGTIGAEFYRGAADTQFGSLKRNSGVFAELRYGF